MALIDDLLFETERRSILFHKDTSMPDATQLGYDGDPNNAVPGNSDGEFLLHNSPGGTRYMQKNTTPYTIWKKVSDAPGGTWEQEASGSVGAPPLIGIYTVTAKYAANEVITVTTGAGSIAGTSTLSGNAITTIGSSANDFNNNTQAGIRMNGCYQIKSVDAIWDSSTTFHFIHPLDVGDTFEIIMNA